MLAGIMSEVDESNKESLQLVQELGSGAWLTSLPIQQLGYAYSKVDNYAGFGTFYTACLGLCDVHVSKGKLLHLHPRQGLSLLHANCR